MQQSEDLQLALLIFRVGNTWLALSTEFFREVSFRKQIHHLPHRSGDILLGLVNWNGILQICVSLKNLFAVDISSLTPVESSKTESEHMLAIENKENTWIFLTDEIEGIRYFSSKFIEGLKLVKQYECFSRVIQEEGRLIYLIDENQFFEHLKRLVI